MSALQNGSGFADPAGARRIVRRVELRERLRCVQASVSTLKKRLDEARQMDAGAVPTVESERLDLADRDLANAIADSRIDGLLGRDEREKELLEGIDLVLQLLDKVGVGLEHGLFSLKHANEPKSATDAGHRLCGAAK
ncbi:hypothetical protein VO57_015605 [Citromicrobium bathyomarinum]|nr:hypothetical protein [Citromicrobium sp. JL2201]